jgi:hypothetical protein
VASRADLHAVSLDTAAQSRARRFPTNEIYTGSSQLFEREREVGDRSIIESLNAEIHISAGVRLAARDERPE